MQRRNIESHTVIPTMRGLCVRRDEIVQPLAALYHDVADGAFYKVDQVAAQVQRHDVHRRKVRKAVCQRHRQRPYRYAVEKEGDECFAAGAQRKVARVAE